MSEELQENIEMSSRLLIADDKFDFNEEADISQSDLLADKVSAAYRTTIEPKPSKPPHLKVEKHKKAESVSQVPKKGIFLPRRKLIYNNFRSSEEIRAKP